MARIQMNYPGVGSASMDICIPQYSMADKQAGITEDEFYGRKFPVLWLLHGEGESCSDWFRFTLLEVYAQQTGIAVVCPTIENSFGVNVKKGDPWENFLTGNLRTAVCSMFPFSDKREDNYIAGVSMGGYAALRLGLRHPEIYSVVGSIDGIISLEEKLLSYWWNEKQLAYVFGKNRGWTAKEYQIWPLLVLKKQKPEVYLFCHQDNRQFEQNKRLKEELDHSDFVSLFREEASKESKYEVRNRQLREFLLQIKNKNN